MPQPKPLSKPTTFRTHRKMSRNLLSWYECNKREMPWRNRPTLYYTLVSEFMLQQTRVDQALPYFKRFVKKFPSMAKLSKAPLTDVLKAWEGLGYYSRARNLQRSAQALTGKRKVTTEMLLACPGIGPYTLAAISSIVFKEPLPVVDGNVFRILSRLLTMDSPPTTPENRRLITEHLTQWITHDNPGDWNQALMELGATVCHPRNPLCTDCPISNWCAAYKSGTQEQFPKKVPAKARPHQNWAAALIRRKGKDKRILIAQRPAKGLLANLWEFPGGQIKVKRISGAHCEQIVAKKLNITIQAGKKINEIKHVFSHFSLKLHVFEARILSGRASSTEYQKWKWVPISQLNEFPFPRSNWSILEGLGISLNDRR